MKEEIIKALKWRYATKVFDSTKSISDEDLNTILEAGRLSPSSVGLEPWKFIVVENKELREKMKAASYNQAQITDSARLIVIATRTDSENISDELIKRAMIAQGKTAEDLAGLKQMADGFITGQKGAGNLEGWFKSQAYIPLGTMIETASLLGIDNCPMEGFDPNKINEILGLSSKNLTATTILALGYRGEDKYSKNAKIRREFNDVVEIIK